MSGIFRESGNVTTIKSMSQKYDFGMQNTHRKNFIKFTFDSGKEVDFTDMDMREVSGLFKYYFRMLPEPLFPFELYQQFIHINSTSLSLSFLLLLSFTKQLGIAPSSPPEQTLSHYKNLIKAIPDTDRV